MASLVELIEEWDGDWEWGSKDCIGFMFEVVNRRRAALFDRDDYIPPGLSYHQACEWLDKSYKHPLEPYQKFLSVDAGMRRCYGGGDIILAYGGQPIRSLRGHLAYPIEPVPGIIFRNDNGEHYAYLKDGIQRVAFYGDLVRNVARYSF